MLVDRWNRHRLILVRQSLAMAQAFVLALLIWMGYIELWQLVVLSLFLGLVNTIDMTARQAFLSEMVTDRADLSNAIALNSSIFNGARLIGPTLAGFLLAQTSAEVCFLLNGLSYLAVLLALLAMRLEQTRRERSPDSLRQGLHEGFQYVGGFAPIRALLLLLGLTSLVGSSYPVLLPEFTVRRLEGDARTLVFLLAAAGLGALTGALFLASRKSVLGLGRWILMALTLLGSGLLAFAWVANFALALVVLFAIGFGIIVEMAGSNTLLQTIAAEDKRGRVMSFYTLASQGMAPLGSLLTGFVSVRLGLSITFFVNGLLCLASALVFGARLPRLRVLVRPIYERLHILPPLTTGIAAASELETVMKG